MHGLPHCEAVVGYRTGGERLMSGTSRSHSRLRASGDGDLLRRRSQGGLSNDKARQILRGLDAAERTAERRAEREPPRAWDADAQPPGDGRPEPPVRLPECGGIPGLAYEVLSPSGIRIYGTFATWQEARVAAHRVGGKLRAVSTG